MDTPGWRSHRVDATKLLQPAVDPRTVVEGALDRLPEGGAFLADGGLELVDGIARRERVDLLSRTTASMYPEEYGPIDA
jgi:hypothetical protein